MVNSCVVTSAPTGILLLMSIGEIRHLCVRYFLSSIKEFTDTEANRQKLYLEEEVLERAKQTHWGAAGQQTSSEELGCFCCGLEMLRGKCLVGIIRLFSLF